MPCEIDLLLCCGSLSKRNASLCRIGASADGTRDQGAEHERGAQEALAAVCVNGPRDVPLGDVRDFMSEDTGELVLIAGRFDEPGVYADVTAGQRKCVDTRVVDDKESEIVVALVGLCGDAMPDLVDVFGDLRVFDNLAAAANILHDRAADLCLGRFGQQGVGRAAHVG